MGGASGRGQSKKGSRSLLRGWGGPGTEEMEHSGVAARCQGREACESCAYVISIAHLHMNVSIGSYDSCEQCC